MRTDAKTVCRYLAETHLILPLPGENLTTRDGKGNNILAGTHSHYKWPFFAINQCIGWHKTVVIFNNNSFPPHKSNTTDQIFCKYQKNQHTSSNISYRIF